MGDDADDADDADDTDDAGDGDEALPVADPAFRSHFTDPLYDDQADELAPFGTDEGWDLVMEWGERRDELTARSTLRQLLADSDFEGIEDQLAVPETSAVPAAGGQVEAAVVLVGAGFTLLRLTGHLDPDGRATVLRALDVLIDRYDSPAELLRQRDDLTTWAVTSR